MSGYLQDPMFFYSIAFVIFLALVWRYGRTPIVSWLDSEIFKIRQELEQAHRLRMEAEAVLATYQKKYTEAMSEAEKIVRHAEEEAVRLKEQADRDLKVALGRYEQQMMDRIRMAEAEAVSAVRSAAVDGAVAVANKKLALVNDDVTATRITDQAIAEIPDITARKVLAA